MPRNNSQQRREARRAAAQAAEAERSKTGSIQSNQLVLSVEEQARDIIDGAAILYGAAEWMLRLTHQCGSPATCSFPAKACSAINQNMPQHMIEGQIKS